MARIMCLLWISITSREEKRSDSAHTTLHNRQQQERKREENEILDIHSLSLIARIHFRLANFEEQTKIGVRSHYDVEGFDGGDEGVDLPEESLKEDVLRETESERAKTGRKRLKVVEVVQLHGSGEVCRSLFY